MNTTELERKLVNLEAAVDRLERAIVNLRIEDVLQAISESVSDGISRARADQEAPKMIPVGSDGELILPAHPGEYKQRTSFMLGDREVLRTNFLYKEKLLGTQIWIAQQQYKVLAKDHKLVVEHRKAVDLEIFTLGEV